MIIAVVLELAMLTTFICEHSGIGVAIWAAYFFFSATCAALRAPTE